MTSDNEAGSGLRARLGRYSDELIRLAVLGVPLALLDRGIDWVEGRFFDEPWEILWFALPLAAAAWMLWRTAGDGAGLRLGGPFLGFLAAYIVVFTVIANARLLDVRQPRLTNLGDEMPRTWLFVNWMGDWRYAIAPRARPVPPRMVLVTVEEPGHDRTLEEVRFEIDRLIRLADTHGARGIAFDFYLTEPSGIDTLLCHTVENVEIPVVMGYGIDDSMGVPRAHPLPANLASCFGDEDRRGHLVVYAGADGVVRSLPLGFLGQADRPALSVRVAELLQPSGNETTRTGPEGSVLYFLPATGQTEEDDPYYTVSMADLEDDPEMPEVLRDRFVLVGEASERDTLTTPFGERPGVALHADAIHSLRTGHAIRRTPWWSGFGMILVGCYVMAAMAARGARPSLLVAVTGGIAVTVVTSAALAMLWWLVWLDVAYPLVAVGLLLPLLLLFRRRVGSS